MLELESDEATRQGSSDADCILEIKWKDNAYNIKQLKHAAGWVETVRTLIDEAMVGFNGDKV